MEHRPPSLRGRIALAIALTVAFYVLALGLAAALIVGPIVLAVQAHVTNLWFIVACEVAGFSILRGIVPRRLDYEPAGPHLTREAQPDLHAFLEDVARAAGDEPADEVYLAPDVNAGVAEVGRTPRRRVLTLGLPLLQVLDVEALRAVIAHEHGHYVAGDTRVGPWVWRTRETLGRTIGRLEQGGRLDRLSARVLHAYGKLFLRITNAVSRRQELAADALAARVAGADAHRRALITLERAGLVFDSYLDRDVNPALGAGVHPPIAEGFARFLAVPHIRQGLDDVIGEALRTQAGTPYDSHPTLRERIAALDAAAGADLQQHEPDAPAATTLLRDVPALEQGLLSGGGKEVRPIRWEDVGTAASLPTMRANLVEEAALLGDARVRDAGRLAARPRDLYDVMFREMPPAGADQHALAREAVLDLLACAVAVALASSGWRLERLPGQPMRLMRGDDELRPGVLLGEIMHEEDWAAGVATWEATCDRLGIADVPLATPAADEDPAAAPSEPRGAQAPDQSAAGTAR